MVKRSADKAVDVKKNMFNGDGEVILQHIRSAGDELYNKGRIFSHVILNKNCEIGWHVHKGDGEVYYLLKGSIEYNDNGTMTTMGPGDVSFCDDGEGHSAKNVGDEPAEMIALVLYK